MKKSSVFVLALTLCIAAAPGCRDRSDSGPTVTIFAASSLVDALPEAVRSIADSLAGIRVVYNFAGSSTLARQISAGSPADLFLSANPDWMRFLLDKKLIAADSVFSFLNNKLAVVIPAQGDFRPGTLAQLDGGSLRHLAIGDPAHVPAGMYARQALQKAGLWQTLLPRLVMAQDVRAALAFVEAGEAQAGIVYATDARISSRVRTAFLLPDSLQPEISYQIAALPKASPAAHRLFNLLLRREAQAVFEKFGFIPHNL